MLLSIIIPFYNTMDYIAEAIDSIMLELDSFDLNNIQVIIVNDGSKQNLSEFISKYYQQKINIELHNKPNGNWGSVINYVKNNHLAKGEYITILDSDDKFCIDFFLNIKSYLSKQRPDILIGNYFKWISNKNKTIRIKPILSLKSKFWNINNKNIHKFKTPYSFPIGKFYKNKIFYKVKNLKENVYYQDVEFYYQCLELSKTFGYLNKTLGYWRSDRLDSSTRMEWSQKKIDEWVLVLQTLAIHDALMIAIWYMIVKGFKKYYKLKHQNKFKLKATIKMCYLPKILWPFMLFFLIFLWLKFRSIVKILK